mgnify:FL=1
MPNLYIPGCALILATLLITIFFSKKRAKNDETKIYTYLLISSFIDSLLLFVILLIGYVSPNNEAVIFLLNKIDFSMYILWIWLMFIYFFKISITKDKVLKYYNIVLKSTFIINIILIIVMWILPINIINQGGQMGVTGIAVDFSMYVFVIYLLLIIMVSLFKFKIINKKYAPLYLLIILLVISLVIKKYNPTFLFTSAVISYVNLIMFFTIENPDVKMVKELEVAKSSAEKANKAKSEFLSSMSHELRTPLNAIVCFSELLETKEGLDEESKSFAKDIVSASHNLLELVNGVLDISKIEAGKMELINKEYNPYNLFNSLGTMVIPRIGDKNITFETHLASDLPGTLKGDTGKIKQIVLNLLTNAVKYTDEGYISYKVNSLNDFKNNKCYMYVTVTDSGRGIKPEDLNRLFEKFERLDEDKNSSIEGTGLGLAITQSLANLMGGKITVVSKYGEGSTFKFVFVQEIIKEENEISLEEVKEETLNYDFTGKNILVVDDSKLNLRVAQNVLKTFNANVMTSTSGQECLDLCKTNKYDIILMDIMMPLMNGIETLKRIRIDDEKVPVIALTADAVEGMEEKYLSEGFNDYLSKPIDRNKLGIILNKYLKGEEKNE